MPKSHDNQPHGKACTACAIGRLIGVLGARHLGQEAGNELGEEVS